MKKIKDRCAWNNEFKCPIIPFLEALLKEPIMAFNATELNERAKKYYADKEHVTVEEYISSDLPKYCDICPFMPSWMRMLQLQGKAIVG
jgi:hypothetical protein